jgi:hypothetical protein
MLARSSSASISHKIPRELDEVKLTTVLDQGIAGAHALKPENQGARSIGRRCWLPSTGLECRGDLRARLPIGAVYLLSPLESEAHDVRPDR